MLSVAYLKFSMNETISLPMRFWASPVAAPMCGVQETLGMLYSSASGKLFRPDVQTGRTNLAGLQSLKQGRFVDVGAAGGVDDGHAVLHLGDGLGVDQGAAVNSGSMDGDESDSASSSSIST